MTLLGFGIVIYMRYNKTKPFNPTVAFFTMVSPKRLIKRVKYAKSRVRSSKMGDPQ